MHISIQTYVTDDRTRTWSSIPPVFLLDSDVNGSPRIKPQINLVTLPDPSLFMFVTKLLLLLSQKYHTGSSQLAAIEKHGAGYEDVLKELRGHWQPHQSVSQALCNQKPTLDATWSRILDDSRKYLALEWPENDHPELN